MQDERLHAAMRRADRKTFHRRRLSEDLVKIVQAAGSRQALIDASPDKVMFTGSVATGRRVAEACAKS